jgi:hypothetical protein
MSGAGKPRGGRDPTEKGSDRRAIIGAVDTNIKLFALVVLAMEAGFVAALATLPATDVKLALGAMAAVGTVAIVGGVWLHRIDKSAVSATGLQPSALTPNVPLLNELVRGAIETVCRAVSLPQTPESARLRVFIFRVDGNSLVCTHFWSPNPTQEEVGLRFELRPSLANQVAVVRAALNRRITGTPVEKLPPDLTGVEGEVSSDLKFVLAAPIIDTNQRVWGVVDFDTTTEVGRSLLQSEISDQVMFQLARHLLLIFTLQRADPQGAAAVSL